MLNSEGASHALRALEDYIAKEHDPKELAELVVAIDQLLILLETRVAALEQKGPPSTR